MHVTYFPAQCGAKVIRGFGHAAPSLSHIAILERLSKGRLNKMAINKRSKAVVVTLSASQRRKKARFRKPREFTNLITKKDTILKDSPSWHDILLAFGYKEIANWNNANYNRPPEQSLTMYMLYIDTSEHMS